MSACPPAAAAASVILLILQNIQQVKTNQENCARLARRCATILADVNDQMSGRWDSAPDYMKKNLEKFCETLSSIHYYVNLQSDMNWRKRIVKKASIEQSFAELDELLTDANQRFQMSALISIHHAVSPQRPRTPTSGAESPDSKSPGHSDAIESSTLLPINPEACLSFREQPLYQFHDYARPAQSAVNLHIPDSHFHEYRLSEIYACRSDASDTEFGWWCGTCEVVVEGKVIVMKRYDKYRDLRRNQKDWLRDLLLLRNMFHPNLPQLLGSSPQTSFKPFILVANVPLRSPQQAILEDLLASSIPSCARTLLHIYHELKSVIDYLRESFTLSHLQLQSIFDDVSAGIDESNSIMLGLPEQSDGHVVTYRNHGLLESVRTFCLNMLPRYPLEQSENSELLREKREGNMKSLLRDLVIAVCQLLRYHRIPTSDGDWISYEEDCNCDEPMDYPSHTNPIWKKHDPIAVSNFSVWDFGYVPEGKGIETFVRLGNAIKDELTTFPVEESTSGVQWRSNDALGPLDLPYLGLPDRNACWTVEVPLNSRIMGQIIHQQRIPEEEAWRFLLQSGEILAREFDVRLQDIRLITGVETIEDFDISYYKDTWDEPLSSTMYLLTGLDRAPYLSSTPNREHSGSILPELEPDWVCTIKERVGAIQSVAVIAGQD